MTTPDKDLAARLAFIAASHDELQIGKTVEKAAAEMELRYHLHAAYRSNQLITTAEAYARVKAAVLAEREAIAAFVETHAYTDGNERKMEPSKQAINDMHHATIAAAIRSRGVTG